MTFENDKAEVSTWIRQHCPEFADVPREVQTAAFYFIILWSVFDSRSLNRAGTRDQVAGYCDGLPVEVPFEPFQIYWDYYHDRFADSTGTNANFTDLVGNDYQTGQILQPIIGAQQGTPKDKLSALIWISYLLRCNLVHGRKHQKGINDQYDNLMMGAKLMTKIMSLHHS